MQHTVSRNAWRIIRERIAQQALTLATLQEAIGEFACDYRLLSEIHTIERETAAEIRQFLRDTYVDGPVLATAPA